ncbi:MAG: toxin TumE [Pseudanabaena sp.]
MSRNNFRDYFDQLDRLLDAYPDVYVENYNATILSTERANLKLRLRFYFKYLLSISEALVVVDEQIQVIDYRYHFQDGQNSLIFRYDNTPHFPNLSNFPHHKHLADQVISSNQPSIATVIQDAITLLEEVESSDVN